MPAPVNRISVSTASTRQQKLLEYEAKLTGRSVSSLASALLEEIIDQKVQAGHWHPTATRLVEELIKAREGSIALEHESALSSMREEEDELAEQWKEILSHLELPSSRMLLNQQTKLVELNGKEAVVMVAANWLGMVESRTALIESAMKEVFTAATCPRLVLKSDEGHVKGHFTDGLWADVSREEELIAYGMKYGLTREEAEDVFEDNQDGKRSTIRWQMRMAAGHEERLPEGESIERKGEDEDVIPF